MAKSKSYCINYSKQAAVTTSRLNVYVHDVSDFFKLLGLSSDDPLSSLFAIIRVLQVPGGDILEDLVYQLVLSWLGLHGKTSSATVPVT